MDPRQRLTRDACLATCAAILFYFIAYVVSTPALYEGRLPGEPVGMLIRAANWSITAVALYVVVLTWITRLPLWRKWDGFAHGFGLLIAKAGPQFVPRLGDMDLKDIALYSVVNASLYMPALLAPLCTCFVWYKSREWSIEQNSRLSQAADPSPSEQPANPDQ